GFGQLARETLRQEGVRAHLVDDANAPTGAAFIFIDTASGQNAILVSPGAAGALTAEDVETFAPTIASARVFVTQLEQPLSAARRGLEIARRQGVKTVFNPAPAADLAPEIISLCDVVIPNESEAEALTGGPIHSLDDARR